MNSDREDLKSDHSHPRHTGDGSGLPLENRDVFSPDIEKCLLFLLTVRGTQNCDLMICYNSALYG